MKLFFAYLLPAVFFASVLSSLSKDSHDINSVKSAFDVKNMDKSVSPGSDFFRYVNGNWMKNNPIPDDESRWSAFNVLNEDNQAKLKSLFEEAASGTHKDAIWTKIGNFYKSGMNTDLIEKNGSEPLKPFLQKINQSKSLKDVIEVSSYFNSYGISTFFSYWVGPDDKNSSVNIFSFYQGGLTLPERDYYIDEDERMIDVRKKYSAHITNMFKLINFPEDASIKAGEIVLKIETDIANVSRTNVALRDPEKNYSRIKFLAFQSNFSNFDLNIFFKTIGINNPYDMNVGQPDFFDGLNKIITKYSVEDWKIFLTWRLLTESAPNLSSNFVNENFDFFGKTLSGIPTMKDRWKRVLNSVNGMLGEPVGKIYVEKYFPKESKEKMLDLVENLRASLKNRLENVDWMAKETKVKAVEKLAKMRVKIGYPDKWKDFSKLEISDNNYFQNILNSSKFLLQDNLSKNGNEVDKDEWHMTPQTINAYYSPNGNEIVFPAAILQAPFFDVKADDAINYGAIGVVIGHEMTHGFDDQGRSYDVSGNLKDWWTKEDAENFTKKSKVLIDQFNSYKVINDMTINGELTLGENIADFGGLKVSVDALKMKLKNKMDSPKIDGFSPLQRFFLSYAQIWRQNIRDEELINRLKGDVHSPGEYRVNGGVVNIPEFYDAFGIKSSDKLFVKPENRAYIW